MSFTSPTRCGTRSFFHTTLYINSCVMVGTLVFHNAGHTVPSCRSVGAISANQAVVCVCVCVRVCVGGGGGLVHIAFWRLCGMCAGLGPVTNNGRPRTVTVPCFDLSAVRLPGYWTAFHKGSASVPCSSVD